MSQKNSRPWSIRKSKQDETTGQIKWRCTGCDQWLCSEYFTKASRAKSGLSNLCKECQKWRMKLCNYGITKQQYDAIFHQQGGVCAVCGCTPDSDRCTHGHLVVDHCHGTGIVRGLLCSRCNSTIGGSMDNVATLESLIRYIKQPPALPMDIKR